MSLSKQECINSIDILDLMTCCYCDEVECEKCPYYTGSDIYCKADEAINMLYELIYEYFELIEENKHLQSQSSKYQEALDIYSHLEDEGTVSDYTPLEYQKAKFKIQELIERVTPRRVVLEDDGFHCPNCKLKLETKLVDSVHCHYCGQKLR